jgi:hypothetical protein
MTIDLPVLLDHTKYELFPVLDEKEQHFLSEASNLFRDEYYSYSLLAVWNAAVNNLRRKIEAYGVDLWQSVVKDEPGRKKYKEDGESIPDRWEGIDDSVLILGASRLGLLNKKAGKTLEMINWMRNHASPAHGSECVAEKEDVAALVLLLQKNLFESPLPDPGQSVGSLFDPVKNNDLDLNQLKPLKDQIRSLRPQDLRICFGFMLDILCKGEQPGTNNVQSLFPIVWELANDTLRKVAGENYFSFTVAPESDDSKDKGAKTRLLEFLIIVEGVHFIPDGARSALFRKAASQLAKAKDTSYGFSDELSAAKTLQQLGSCVPNIAFEEVYQEILAVWCGNYWRRSGAHNYLGDFIDSLTTDQIRSLARMFRENERVRDELYQSKPKAQAIKLLDELKEKLTIESHKNEIDHTKESIEEL